MNIKNKFRDLCLYRVWIQGVRDQVYGRVCDQIRGQVEIVIWDRVWNRISRLVFSRIFDQIGKNNENK